MGIPYSGNTKIATVVGNDDYLGVEQGGQGREFMKKVRKEVLFQKTSDDIEAINDNQKVELINKVVNSNFNNFPTSWEIGGATWTVNNNFLTLTGDGSSAESYLTQSNIADITAGDKIFCCMKVKVTNSECTKIDLRLRVSTGLITVFSQTTPIQNKSYEICGILESPGDYINSYLRVYQFYADSATANGKVMEIDGNAGVFYLNLSNIFGKGKEPESNLMKRFVEETGHFDGVHNLSNLQILNSFNNYIKENVLEQEDYIYPTLLSSWENYGSSFVPARFYKNTMGEVIIEGLLKNGASNTIAFELPIGYRPEYTLNFVIVNGATAIGMCQVSASGAVKIFITATATDVSISGISFRAAA